MRYKYTVAWLESQIKISSSLLANKNWATSDSDYHRDCRARKQQELDEYVRVLKKLSK